MGADYQNTETKQLMSGGGRMVRKVSIKNGTGYKSIEMYKNGKKLFSVKKPINRSHIQLIQSGVFVPGLFNDCKKCNKFKTRKNRK